MAKIKIKKKSYNYGGNIDLEPYDRSLDYSDEPSKMIAQNNINFAKAKAQVASNPLIQGGKMFGKAATKIGASMLTKAIPGTLDDNLIPLGLQGLDMFQQNQGMNSFAYGGNTSHIPVEVEGEEVMETPNGEVAEFNGPKHEQGGINMDLPEGTDIYSDRISVDGKTMAERKTGREKKIKSINNKLKTNPNDQVLKNTLGRVQMIFEMEDEQDKQIQESVKQIKEGASQKFKLGGKIKLGYGAKSFGSVDPKTSLPTSSFTTPPTQEEYDDFLNVMKPQYKIPFLKNPGLSKLSFTPDTTDNTSFNNPNDTIEVDTSKSSLNYTPQDYNKETPSNSLKSTEDFNSGLQIGDMLAMGGDLFQSYAPFLNTLNQRGTDQPNINASKNVGKDSIETIQGTKGYVKQLRDKALTDLELDRTSATKRNRNSARGINTQRALDLATQQIANKGQNDVYANSVNQMLAIANQESDAQYKRDVNFAEGEKLRDMNDRKDKDAFYTQHSTDLRNVGQSISKTGKSVNKIKENKDKESILNQFYDNFEFDFSTGQIKAKKNK